jgi:hypothetical protein
VTTTPSPPAFVLGPGQGQLNADVYEAVLKRVVRRLFRLGLQTPDPALLTLTARGERRAAATPPPIVVSL